MIARSCPQSVGNLIGWVLVLALVAAKPALCENANAEEKLRNLNLTIAREEGPRGPSTSATLGVKASWPFAPWSHVKAYAFNFFPARHGVQLRVLENGVWSPHIRSEVPLDHESAQHVAALVESTKGTFETSKCPFPRHAFVFFDVDGKPVGAVDICFECDDLFVWPDYTVNPEVKYGGFEVPDVGNLDLSEGSISPKGGLWHNFEAAMSEYKDILERLGLPLQHR